MTSTVPTARVVSADYVPTVSQSEILSDAVAKIIRNSGELQRIGVDPSKIEAPSDVAKMLDDAAAHIERNIDPRAARTITFDEQKQLAAETGMTVEQLLSRHPGENWNAERSIAARSLLKDSQTNVMNLALNAAQGDTDYLAQFAKGLAQHQAVVDQVRGVASEAGRALGSYRIREADLPALKITNAFAQLPAESLQKAAKLLSKIDPNDDFQVNEFISELKPSTPAEKVFEYFRNSLLSGPHTIAVKGASEFGMLALEATSKAVRGGLAGC